MNQTVEIGRAPGGKPISVPTLGNALIAGDVATGKTRLVRTYTGQMRAQGATAVNVRMSSSPGWVADDGNPNDRLWIDEQSLLGNLEEISGVFRSMSDDILGDDHAFLLTLDDVPLHLPEVAAEVCRVLRAARSARVNVVLTAYPYLLAITPYPELWELCATVIRLEPGPAEPGIFTLATNGQPGHVLGRAYNINYYAS